MDPEVSKLITQAMFVVLFCVHSLAMLQMFTVAMKRDQQPSKPMQPPQPVVVPKPSSASSPFGGPRTSTKNDAFIEHLSRRGIFGSREGDDQ